MVPETLSPASLPQLIEVLGVMPQATPRMVLRSGPRIVFVSFRPGTDSTAAIVGRPTVAPGRLPDASIWFEATGA